MELFIILFLLCPIWVPLLCELLFGNNRGGRNENTYTQQYSRQYVPSEQYRPQYRPREEYRPRYEQQRTRQYKPEGQSDRHEQPDITQHIYEHKYTDGNRQPDRKPDGQVLNQESPTSSKVAAPNIGNETMEELIGAITPDDADVLKGREAEKALEDLYIQEGYEASMADAYMNDYSDPSEAV